MRKASVSLMAFLALTLNAMACTPERELFSDTVVREDVVRSAEAR